MNLKSPDTVRADIASADPERIRSALQELKRRRDANDEFALPLPGLAMLDAFGPEVPPDVQRAFLNVIARYRGFEASLEERLVVLIELILRYAHGQCSFDLALKLKIAKDPVVAVGLAMDEVQRQLAIDSKPAAVKGAGQLVSRLLDGQAPVRRATLDKLQAWPRAAPYQAVVNHIAPQLDDADRARLSER